jgi:class 3 adenylate cyclase/pimeloyl-ACP methyl ester carboxylesterase
MSSRVSASHSVCSRYEVGPMAEPRIQYARTKDGVNIAYAVAGDGPPLVYLVGPPFTHVQQMWRIPSYTRWNERLAATRKLVLLDCRGSGLSERDVAAFSLGDLCLDVDAVADRLGLDSFALIGSQAGGLIAIRYALTRPQRVSLLCLFEAYPSGKHYFDIPQVRAFVAMMETDWELFTETLANYGYGWTVGEPARQFAAFLRECVTAHDAQRFFEAVRESDLSPHLGEIMQPALVVQHRSMLFSGVDTAKALAAGIPNAQLLLLDGTWLEPGSDIDAVVGTLDEMQGIGASPAATAQPAVGSLVTILFTDLVGHTEMMQRLGDERGRDVLREHETITRNVLRQHAGTEVKMMGDGFMASFGSVTKAVECAIALQRAFAEREGEPLAVRVGLNAGEPIEEDGDLFGSTVILASRIAAHAGAGEILIPEPVRHLLSGKPFVYADRGEFVPKGFEDPVRLYEVRWREDG